MQLNGFLDFGIWFWNESCTASHNKQCFCLSFENFMKFVLVIFSSPLHFPTQSNFRFFLSLKKQMKNKQSEPGSPISAGWLSLSLEPMWRVWWHTQCHSLHWRKQTSLSQQLSVVKSFLSNRGFMAAYSMMFFVEKVFKASTIFNEPFTI